jgi:hypothetical protein
MTQKVSKRKWLLVKIFSVLAILALILLGLMLSGCHKYSGVGQNGEYFESIHFASDSEFDAMAFVYDPNSGLAVFVVDNYSSDSETEATGTLIGNILKTFTKP